MQGTPLVEAEQWLADRHAELSQAEREFIQAGVAQREAAHQRELEAAQKLAESESRRAEDQAQATRRLRRRAFLLTGASVLAVVLAAIAFLAFRQANQNARTAQAASTRAVGQQAAAETAQALEADQRATAVAEGWARATQQVVAQAEAEARATQQAVAEEQARLATSRELAAAAVANLYVDPERSVLLALQGLATADTLEVRNALHRALPELRVLHSVTAHDAAIYSVSFSPDGTRLATSSADATAKIWDASTHQLLLTLKAGDGDVFDVVWSPDATRLATSGITDVIIWDLATRRQVLTLPGEFVGHTTGIFRGVGRVDFSPDGTRLAVANQDGVPKVWDISTPLNAGLATATPVLSLAGHAEVCWAIAYSPDGTLLATGSGDGAVKVWDAQSGRKLRSLPGHSFYIHRVAFSPDGARLAAVDDAGYLTIWDVASAETLLSLISPSAGAFRTVLFLLDGSAVVTTGYDGTARIWDTTTGSQRLLLAGHTGSLLDAAVSPDGRTLAGVGVDGTLKVWDLGPGHELLTLDVQPGTAGKVAYAPDGRHLAAAATDGKIRIWDWATGELATELSTDPPHPWIGVAYSLDGAHLAASAIDGVWALWDLESGRVAATVAGHTNLSSSIAISSDGQHLATSSHDGTAKVWDISKTLESGGSPEAVVTFTDHIQSGTTSNWVHDIAFSPNGQLVASAGSGAVVHLWDPVTGQIQLTLPGGPETRLTTGVAFSPNGTLIAIGELSGLIRVCETATGRLVHVLAGHSAGVFDLDFSADGRLLASSAFDLLAKVWDVQPGEEMATLYGNAGRVMGVAFSPDGTQVATGAEDGTVRFYAVRVQDLVALARSRVTRSLTTQECQKYLHLDECP